MEVGAAATHPWCPLRGAMELVGAAAIRAPVEVMICLNSSVPIHVPVCHPAPPLFLEEE